MKVDQAVYGLGTSGHSLLGSSGNREVFKEIERRMDLPNTAPHGIVWSPYFSGFAWKQYFVLSKTELDAMATRGGVVFTRALLVPIEEIIAITNIEPFFQYLAQAGTSIPETVSYADVTQSAENVPVPSSLVALTNAISSREAGPAVWVGLNGFDHAVIALWSILWPELRRSLVFRLSFGPDDLIEKPAPNLVVTPQGLAAKWASGKFVDLRSTEIEPSQVTSALLDSEVAKRLEQVVVDYGLRVRSFQDVLLTQHLQKEIERKDFTSQVSSLRVIESLSQSSDNGRDAKRFLLNGITSQVPGLDAAQVLPLRNLQITKIEGFQRFWSALEKWFGTNSFLESEDASFLGIIQAALTSSASIEAWSHAIKGGLREAALHPTDVFPSAVWRWIIEKADLTISLFSLFPDDDQMQTRLFKNIPTKLPETTGMALLEVCQQRKWLRLHGAVSRRIFDVRESIRRQLTIDTDASYVEGLLLAIGVAPDSDVIEAAVSSGDSRLIHLAAERVSKDPNNLADSDFGLHRVQRIWAEAILESSSSWKAPRAPHSVVANILDKMIDGQEFYEPLVDAVAHTPLADLSGYSRRSVLWEKLTPTQRRPFLQATARSFVEQRAGATSFERPEPLLESAVLESDHTYEVLAKAIQARPNLLVEIASTLPSFNESHFERLLARVLATTTSIQMSISLLLGDWIRRNNWRGSAQWVLMRMLQGRNDLRAILTQCADLFPWFTRLRYQLSTVSSEQKWAALREIASTLYPSGPDHHQIWERSGGKNKELEHHGDGESRWTGALNRMRNGNGIHPGRLIHEMRQEYPMNEELRFLAEDIEFGGWRR